MVLHNTVVPITVTAQNNFEKTTKKKRIMRMSFGLGKTEELVRDLTNSHLAVKEYLAVTHEIKGWIWLHKSYIIIAKKAIVVVPV